MKRSRSPRRPSTPVAPAPAARTAPAGQAIPAPPPMRRDPWLWLVLLAALLAPLGALGTPMGEPFADDFDYLRYSLLETEHSFFGGGGSVLYWRPLTRQVYFGLLGPAMVTQPWVVALAHSLVLALSALLLYRAWRPRTSGPWAATAASFPFVLETTRMLVVWPSHAQDLGALLFACLAIHEASRNRLPTALIAMLGALLSKETAALMVPLIPFLPVLPEPTRARRTRWLLATAALGVAWAVAYKLVERHAHLLPFAALTPTEGLGTSWLRRFTWTLEHAARDAFSLGLLEPRWALACGLAVAALGAAMLLGLLTRPDARTRLMGRLGFLAWGLAWFALTLVPVADLYPAWGTHRSVIPALGLGLAIAAVVDAVHPVLLAALIAVRLAAFALSPGAPAMVNVDAQDTGTVYDFPRLARLQRFVHDTRVSLQRAHPTLAKGALLGRHALPRMTEYAFSEGKAFQVWYRDTSIRWVRFEDFRANPALPLAAILEYQPHRKPQISLVNVDAMRALLRASDVLKAGRFAEGLHELARADSLEHDPRNAVFLAIVAGKRAVTLGNLGDREGAAEWARRALAHYPQDADARVVLASLLLDANRVAEAAAQVDTQLVYYPRDTGALALRDSIRARGGR